MYENSLSRQNTVCSLCHFTFNLLFFICFMSKDLMLCLLLLKMFVYSLLFRVEWCNKNVKISSSSERKAARLWYIYVCILLPTLYHFAFISLNLVNWYTWIIKNLCEIVEMYVGVAGKCGRKISLTLEMILKCECLKRDYQSSGIEENFCWKILWKSIFLLQFILLNKCWEDILIYSNFTFAFGKCFESFFCVLICFECAQVLILNIWIIYRFHINMKLSVLYIEFKVYIFKLF